MTTRTFVDSPGVRQQVPVSMCLYGPSGSGKTFSALRLATGFQRVDSGEIFVIDTEANRALHYADRFKFQHVPFTADFSPFDYLAVIEHCVSRGAKTIIIDSMSHEHEGPGGVLEMHTAEHKRLGGSNGVKMLAWSMPKQARRRLINSIVQTPCNFILCFRAKEKLKIVRGADPEPLGFMPIGGEEFIYEMIATALLLPGAYGVPTWFSKEIGEAQMIKRPEQFHELFERLKGQPISEEMGEAIGRWAAGGETKPKASEPFTRLAAAIEAAKTADELASHSRAVKALKKGDVTAAEHAQLVAFGKAKTAALGPAKPAPPIDPDDTREPT